MTAEFAIRSAEVRDAPAIQAIYRHFVETTAVSFELEAPDVGEISRRITAAVEGWGWLVAEVDGALAGYAYGTAHRPREAYRYSVEVSAYLDAAYHRRGIARALYEALFPQLVARDYRNAYAGVTLPNDASMGFHQSLGFKFIGVFPEVGRKFDAWHDVAWLHRPLAN
jgi:phosphinothricin acetyltransferase